MNAPLDHPSYRIADSRPIIFDAIGDDSECVEDMLGRFGYANRAGQASPRAVLHRLGHTVPIAIAVLCIIYFALQLARAL